MTPRLSAIATKSNRVAMSPTGRARGTMPSMYWSQVVSWQGVRRAYWPGCGSPARWQDRLTPLWSRLIPDATWAETPPQPLSGPVSRSTGRNCSTRSRAGSWPGRCWGHSRTRDLRSVPMQLDACTGNIGGTSKGALGAPASVRPARTAAQDRPACPARADHPRRSVRHCPITAAPLRQNGYMRSASAWLSH